MLICGYFAELQRRAVWFYHGFPRNLGTDFHNIVFICAKFVLICGYFAELRRRVGWFYHGSVRGRICDWVGILVVFHICDADFYLDFGWFIFVMGWWKIMGIDNQIDMIFYNF